MIRLKTLSIGSRQDGWARFHYRNISDPAAVQGVDWMIQCAFKIHSWWNRQINKQKKTCLKSDTLTHFDVTHPNKETISNAPCTLQQLLFGLTNWCTALPVQTQPFSFVFPFNPLSRGWHWNGRKALKDMRFHHQPFHFLCCLSQLCMEDGGGGLMDWRCRLLSCSTCAHSWDECFSRRNYLCVCVSV